MNRRKKQMIEHRGRITKRLLVPMMAMGTMTGGVLAATALPASAAPMGYACGYSANVSIFGGAYVQQGCAPNAGGDPNALAPSRSTSGSSADLDGAKAVFSGVATIFSSPYTPSDTLLNSGRFDVSVSLASTTGLVTAKAQTVGPTPFFTWSPGFEYAWAEPAKPGGTAPDADATGTGYVEAKCIANGTTETSQVTVKNGVVDTHIISGGPMSGYPSESVKVPTTFSTPNATSVPYWIENVGDQGYIVFHEKIANADGTTTVNGAHMYMQGANAYGDMVIAQAKCGQ